MPGLDMLRSLRRDVSEYTQVPPLQFRHVAWPSTERLAASWRATKPVGITCIERWYEANSRDYLLDLAWWHLTVALRRHWTRLIVERFADCHTVLDYGCGIGSDGLTLADNGHEVTFADLRGQPIKFARWRAERHGLTSQCNWVEGKPTLALCRQIDAIILIDVLEHLPDWPEVLRLAMLRSKLLAISAPFAPEGEGSSVRHPQHLPEGRRRMVDMLALRGYVPEGALFWRR